MINIAIAFAWAAIKRLIGISVPTLGGMSIFNSILAAIMAVSVAGSFVMGWKAHKRWVAADEVAAIKRDLQHRDMVIADRDADILINDGRILELESELKRFRDAPGADNARVCVDASDPWLQRKSRAAKSRTPMSLIGRPGQGRIQKAAGKPRTFRVDGWSGQAGS